MTVAMTASFCLQIATLDPATHAYSFWEGVPMDAKYAFGCLFAVSKTLQVRNFAALDGQASQDLQDHC